MSTPSFGAIISDIFGASSSADTMLSKNSTYICSRTTNSYGKCVDEIFSKFNLAVANEIRKAIEPHDRNSFTSKILLGEISVDEIGVKRVTGRRYLHVRGTYEYKIFAHLKKVEAWIEDENV